MSTGKRRANWETVLEERMAEERGSTCEMVSDLQRQVDTLKHESFRDRYILAVIASIGLLTAVLK